MVTFKGFAHPKKINSVSYTRFQAFYVRLMLPSRGIRIIVNTSLLAKNGPLKTFTTGKLGGNFDTQVPELSGP